jgi:hypothetical protein
VCRVRKSTKITRSRLITSVASTNIFVSIVLSPPLVSAAGYMEMVGCDWNFWQEPGSNPMMRSGRGMALHLAIVLVLLLPGTGSGSAPSTSGGDGREALPGILHQLLHVGTQAYNRGDYTFASSCFRTVARAERGELLVHCLVAPSHRCISQEDEMEKLQKHQSSSPIKAHAHLESPTKPTCDGRACKSRCWERWAWNVFARPDL